MLACRIDEDGSGKLRFKEWAEAASPSRHKLAKFRMSQEIVLHALHGAFSSYEPYQDTQASPEIGEESKGTTGETGAQSDGSLLGTVGTVLSKVNKNLQDTVNLQKVQALASVTTGLVTGGLSKLASTFSTGQGQSATMDHVHTVRLFLSAV